MNREDETVYTEAQPSQLKSQRAKKYRPIPSHLILLRVARLFDAFKRVETNQSDIYDAASRALSEMLWYLWTYVW